ncbi:response regulator [Geobacter sulfurreducens]|uniref:Winged-helix transcriptional response regulator n=1 Tax=Geobacter sulfurreducens (strain ATCC 51573 / DSM 12127 / PCA) TaxID=243231 RepID=Q747Z7_GEOSL|nr:response regulator [Geobacter sulfurreducens]AAR36509.1 winged-helix transcriptional response regulator [Geobacter sulfurreducens PCA]AJY69357.1 transcriptional regulator [Geobacter sulfurreducens]QVW34912.1 response regulator [Geobacter sulfurreducens]UAC03783.1 response regulator [Geobacter sulfurreducens]HCD95377.1 DNA-binding response regulator [Geobacter sulfurreducens]
MTGTILIVEDEEKIATLLRDYLRLAGFDVCCLAGGAEAAPWVREHAPDLVLLDLMLPGRDGLEICKDVRVFSSVPIIMITARIEEIDRLLGLELGADDYICKPFSPREVVARVKAVLRRSGPGQTTALAGLVMDGACYRAALDGHELDLTAVEFKLLQFLAASPGRIYSRQQLMDRIYPDERVVADRTIDSHIKKLRKKIADVAPGEDLIHSVYGVGYKFERASRRE